jgi:NADH:ubiquinone oxidoreductase subunit 6 (subunit J)
MNLEIGIYVGIVGCLISWAAGMYWQWKARRFPARTGLARKKLISAAVFLAFLGLAAVCGLLIGHPLPWPGQ